jgi:hypothetical protein
MRPFVAGRTAVLFAIAVLSTITSASAEETYPEKQFGSWTVYGWADDCWMKSDFSDGTQLSYSWDSKDDSSYILIRNSKWTSIQKDENYSVKMAIDDWETTDAASGHVADNIPPGVSFFVDEDEKRLLLARMSVGKTLSFFVDDRFVGSYDLKDSSKAVREWAKCAFSLQYKKVNDPFAKP